MNPRLLIVFFLLVVGRLAAQNAPQPVEVLVKNGLSQPEAQAVDGHMTALKAQSPKIQDSTATYEELQLAAKSYQEVGQVLMGKKIKLMHLLAAYPDGRELMQLGKVAKQKLEALEANDWTIRFKKTTLGLDEELRKQGFKGNTEAMLLAFVQKLTALRKTRPQNESYLLDATVVANQLAAVSKSLRTGEDFITNAQFAAAIKRLRRTDLHHDEEFGKKVGYVSLFEKLIATGETFPSL
ncbi:MAG: hypothetical protein MUC97_08750 [Bernardetiaceae bacterium]|jgi:hypothetical protein|nr:hypothetical protein [Bernardetiaceae bacterium]